MRPLGMGIRSIRETIAADTRLVEVMVARRDEIRGILQGQNATLLTHDGGLVRGRLNHRGCASSQHDAEQWEGQSLDEDLHDCKRK